MSDEAPVRRSAKNVLGYDLQPCSTDPMTGFYRDGCCNTGAGDGGVHTVCAIMTEEFLRFSVSRGNDLVTPVPAYEFPGLGARRSLVPVRAALERSLRRRHGAEGRAREHAHLNARVRQPRRTSGACA